MRWMLRIFFALLLVAGVALGIVYPRMLDDSEGDEVGRWRIYEPAIGSRILEIELEDTGPLTVAAEFRSEETLPDGPGVAALAVVRDASGAVVLREPFSITGAAVLESPQSRVQLHRAAAGVLDAADGTYRFEIEMSDNMRSSLLAVDLVLGTVAVPLDPRLQPAGFVLMAIGVVGFVLALRRRRENRNSKPPKWGRV